ncbi:MAG: AraC family transcriptional regulator [Lachnospiraceae bacterium]|nr:AraC family transcriptional regulator [Lachnospiraceae bacterium]
MNILEYENTQELKSHGPEDFPFNIYLCSIPLDFAVVPLHWHNDMEIIYIKKGDGKVTLDLEPFFVQQGDILIVPPGHLHSIEQCEDHSMEYENIIFQLTMLMASQGDACTEEFFQPLLQGQLLLPGCFSRNAPLYPKLALCLDTIDEICKTFPKGYQLAIKGQLFSLFYALASSVQAPLPRQKNKSLDRLKNILKYVETNYHDKISIADAARICGFSQSHFMKFFKSAMNVSFTDYLNDYRLTMAARLLLSSSDSIVTIAVETGFENLSYFNRMFKRKYRCTPTAFRQRSGY